jgi:NAD-dependent SIR2 family protein deacetylase
MLRKLERQLEAIWWRVWDWVGDLSPIKCERCEYLFKPSQIKWLRTTWGAKVPLCQKCYAAETRPFSSGAESLS